MNNFAGLGRLAAAVLLVSGVALGSVARAEDVSEEQLKAARATIDALGVTSRFDSILPTVAEQLKAQLIQATPNFQDVISTTVDGEALKLAARRGDLEKEAATIYAKTFTVEELKAIADFYGSDVGKKLLRDGPVAAREMMKAADIWGAGIQRDLAKESDTALEKELGDKLKATPADPAQ